MGWRKISGLIGTSPLRDQSGRPGQERDWLVDSGVGWQPGIHGVDRAGQDFESLRPTFERMLKSLKLR